MSAESLQSYRVSGVELQACPRASEGCRRPEGAVVFFFWALKEKSSSVEFCISLHTKLTLFPRISPHFNFYRSSN